MITRKHSLSLVGSMLLLAACSAKRVANAVRIGSTGSDENRMIAEIYAAALERVNIPTERRIGLGDSSDLLDALQHGTIDLYPGEVLTEAGNRRHEKRNGIVWLSPSPANLSPCLVTSQYAAEQFWLLRLTKAATIAPRLRLAATRDFLAKDGALQRLRQRYGGFAFRTIAEYSPGEQLDALNRGDADIANTVTTDPSVAENQLIILSDDKHFWPERHIAPIINTAAGHAHPKLAATLERTSHRLTLYALQQLSTRRQLFNMDLRDAAEDFVGRT